MHRINAQVALAVLLTACSGDSYESGVRRASGERVKGTPGGCWPEPRLTDNGVGAIRVGRTITFLPRSCSVRDSVSPNTPNERGHVVRFREHQVLAVTANNTSGLILRVEVTDPAFRTSSDVGVGSSAGTLRSMHAPLCAVATSTGRIALLSEGMPHVTFETSFPAPADPLRVRAIEENSALVPDDARVTRVVVTAAATTCSPPTVAFRSEEGLTIAGGRVVADSLWSQSLGVRKELVVYLPPSYEREPSRRYPVVVMLHGLWGDQWQWVRSDQLATTMDSLVGAGLPEMIVAMPDGDDGWWTTWYRLVDMRGCRAEPLRRRHTPPSDPSSRESAESYCVPWAHYDDYVARDIVAKVDSTYRTLAHRDQRAVGGLSMGGYGAITLALAYPEVFGAAASHSGVLSLLYSGKSEFTPPGTYAKDLGELRTAWGGLWWSVETVFGDVSGFHARDPATLAERLVRRGGAQRPALFIDVGTDDFLLQQNRAFHHRLGEIGYAHHYAEWPGTHDHAYWRAHVRESLNWLGRQFASGRGR